MKGVATAECPVSAITPRSREIVDLYFTDRMFRDRGVSLFGPVVSEWPAWAEDAWLVFDQEEKRIQEGYGRGKNPGNDTQG